MPDENNNPTPVKPPVDQTSTVSPVIPDNPVRDSSAQNPAQSPVAAALEAPATDSPEEFDIKSKVAHEIAESQNVLVALSSDPSVDEMAAAIGLSLFLDRLGKRATAIYSGSTPNALEFLKPEDTFEPSTDTLQDFVVALNKEKADHVRCKVDGDFVKMYITPYKTRVAEEDLEFSYGDYNVDLVLALDVANGIDLDSALREHGRIMHNASVINVTTGNPGRFGEIEWSDKSASSISEMFSDLIFSTNTKAKLSPEEATAFLTGIVAATDRFSTAATTPQTMKIASKLMEAGANQQLISQNITDDIENEMFSISSVKVNEDKDDLAKIEIDHPEDEELSEHEKGTPSDKKKEDEGHENESPKDSKDNSGEDSGGMSQESSLLADLQRAAANLAQAGDETVPTPGEAPIEINSNDSSNDLMTSNDNSTSPVASPTDTPAVALGKDSFTANEMDSQDYSKMLEDALSGAGETPVTTSSQLPVSEPTIPEPTTPEPTNPATMSAPQVPSVPEINKVPEINYAPSADSAILPPPPAPPINENLFTPTDSIMDTPAPVPGVESQPSDGTKPEDSAAPSLGGQPAMQDQVYNPQASDPSAFKIPGL